MSCIKRKLSGSEGRKKKKEQEKDTAKLRTLMSLFVSSVNKVFQGLWRLRLKKVHSSILSNQGQQINLSGSISSNLGTIRLNHQAAVIKPGITSDDKQSFIAMFPSMVADLKDFARRYDNTIAADWFEKAIQYNVSHGKNNRGLMVVLSFKELASDSQFTVDNINKAQTLGWCVELLSGSLLALDDIMDGSETRRKQPCWYKQKDVGLQAINDCLMIENGVYEIIYKYFRDADYYVKLVEMFRELTFITCIGQVLDVQASKVNITNYTMDQYKSLVRAKSSYGTFSLPVFCAMQMCGIPDPKFFTEAENILFEICYFFQAQNDFEDCYGDVKVTGRIGTDIEDNRCTWLAVKAIERASSKQRKILQECYGLKDPEKADKVRKIYQELDLVGLFATYEEDMCKYIQSIVDSKPSDKCSNLFLKIWSMFYRKVPLPNL